MVTQPIEFGTFACKCTASLAEKSRSNTASPGLVPETYGGRRRSRNPLSLALLHASALQASPKSPEAIQPHQGWCRRQVADQARVSRIANQWLRVFCTRCRQELQAGHTVQALAAGGIQIAGRGCGYHTRSSRCLRVPKCEQLLRVLHTVQAQPRVTHALQTWAAGGVPG